VIITRLTIENYKQYRGEHVFAIAEEATVGVLGANGVGKTTIFEAIEWCLYKPRGIENQDIRPRGTGGEVKVVLQLTTHDGARTYEVERILKRSTTMATIYELNAMGGGDPIVQGTREVTDYISSKLIGLGHAAFVATFFTRQKELDFFGTMRPAERRREVGKLLGLETIKQAQELIAQERSMVRADAESLQRQYEGRVKSRDIAAEIDAARATMSNLRRTADRASAALETAEKHATSSEHRMSMLLEKRDRHNAVNAELRTLETRRQHALDQRDGITRQLARLEEREQERTCLARSAGEEPALRAQRARLDSERERHQVRERLLTELDRCHRTIERAHMDVRGIVDQALHTTDDPLWHWIEGDAEAALDGIDRLREVVTSLDLSTSEKTLVDLRTAVVEAEAQRLESEKLKKYQDRRDELHLKVDGLMRDGEPAHMRAALDATLSDARTRKSEALAQVATLTSQINEWRRLADRLEQQHADDLCPTCGRPFTDDEAQVMITTLRGSIQQHDRSVAMMHERIALAEQEIRGVEQALGDLQQREAEIQECRASLESAKEYIRQQVETVDASNRRLQTAMQRLRRKTPPASAAIAAAERELEKARLLKGTDQPLKMLRATIATAQESVARHQRDLEGLEDVEWNAADYEDIVERHGLAMRAASAIEQIDTELAGRPQLCHDLEATRTMAHEVASAIDEQRAALEAVGFEPDRLLDATDAMQTARREAREAREAHSQADRAVHSAEHQLDLLVREQDQIAALHADANAKRALKAELDMMYSEFSEFDKFVAQKQSPLLGEMTSDIVSQMTDGKYDRVEFDEDYGIQVHDNIEERFPLETFSGGERDAIALAARLALSRLIGSQATNPPEFLVLDEVFGSLDSERRERVLALLGQHSTDFFRQMFIISHLDDVQQSPVFDTVWQVIERQDGSSEVVPAVSEVDRELAG
jgi:DNA repair protein SbcC/Rad50